MGFKPRNHPQQMAKMGGACDETDDRRTLPEVFAPWNARFRFTLDAAASEANTKCAKFYTLSDSGLLASWKGERVWCNPPRFAGQEHDNDLAPVAQIEHTELLRRSA